LCVGCACGGNLGEGWFDLLEVMFGCDMGWRFRGGRPSMVDGIGMVFGLMLYMHISRLFVRPLVFDSNELQIEAKRDVQLFSFVKAKWQSMLFDFYPYILPSDR
jgi:hypothetical protein